MNSLNSTHNDRYAELVRIEAMLHRLTSQQRMDFAVWCAAGSASVLPLLAYPRSQSFEQKTFLEKALWTFNWDDETEYPPRRGHFFLDPGYGNWREWRLAEDTLRVITLAITNDDQKTLAALRPVISWLEAATNSGSNKLASDSA